MNQPISIPIKECRKCVRQFYVGGKILKISPDDEIDIIIQTFRCQDCRQKPNDIRIPH